MNHITPTHATWNGMNSSGWRKDIVHLNGFDERMAYGGEDREFGERLCNAGIHPKQIRYSAITLHLDHKRPYANKCAWEKNNKIREETKKYHLVKTMFGLEKYTLKSFTLVFLLFACSILT
jgi:GT2 family glycosyltransferase